MNGADSSAQAVPLPGFGSPVFDSQRAFRGLLDALARPGTVVELAASAGTPRDWPAAMATVALTLIDLDTPVWLDGAAGNDEARRFVAFHCGCPVVGAPGEAAFALVAAPHAMPRLEAFRGGGEADPHTAATVVIACAAFEGGPRVTLSGPGIDGSIDVMPDIGLPDFWAQWARNHRRYPVGVDVLLVSGARILGLPRSVRAKTA